MMSISVKRLISYAAIFMITILAFAFGTAVVSTNAQADDLWPIVEQNIRIIPDGATESERLYATIYNTVSPSVVSINVVSRFQSRLTPTEEGFAEGTGTGFIIDNTGHIITNAHVVEGAVQIEVNFFDGRIVRGEIVGLDNDSDVAVIQVNQPAETLQPISLGDSDALYVGQNVVAIGSPFSQPWTMTTGIISALNRTIRGLNAFSIGSVIQTDAAINPGNSGGPLLNLNGEVIGINSQINSQTRSNSGVGFAIPINLAARVAQSLIETGEMSYSYLGISGGAVSLNIIEALNLPNHARGVVVSTVESRAPAALAGLRPLQGRQNNDGTLVSVQVDIITAINGENLGNMDDLIAYLAAHTSPGQTIELTIIRNGTEQLRLPVTLTARPGQ